METFEKCIDKLESTTSSDSEKLAVLMVVSKILPKLNMNSHLAQRLYEAIGETFFIKLLRLDTTSTCENNQTFKHLSILILSSISKYDCNIVLKNNTLVSELLMIINEKVCKENKETIKELLELLKYLIISSEDLPKVFLDATLLLKLGDKLEDFSDIVLEIMKNLLRHHQPIPIEFYEILLKLSRSYVGTENIEKFHLLDIINTLLTQLLSISTNNKNELSIEIKKELLENLSSANLNILSSKCRPHIKRNVLLMTSSLLKLFQQSRVFTSSSQSKRFILTLLTCASVELAIALEDYNFEDEVASNTEILASLDIAYYSIEYISSEDFLKSDLAMDNDFLLKIFSCFKNIMIPVYQFIRSGYNRNKLCLDNCVFNKCVTLILVWSTEETSSLQDELKSTLPIIMKSVDRHLKSKERVEHDNDLDIMYYAIPCLSQILSDKNLSPVLLSNNIIEMMALYLQQTLDGDNDSISFTQKETLINLLLQLLVIFPKQSRKVFLTFNIEKLSNYVLSEMHESRDTFYRLQLVAFYFSLLRELSVNLEANETVFLVLEKFLQISLKNVNDEGEKNMWSVAMQNISEYTNIKSLNSNNKCLQTLTERRLREISNMDDKELLVAFNNSLNIS